MRQTRATSRRHLVTAVCKLAAAGVAVAATAFGTALPAAAQEAAWPNRPIKMIVPFPAGSFTDTVARVVSDRLAKSLGQPVIVENKAGANGLIGVSEAAKATPDGYTLLVTNSSSVTINPQLYKKAPYKSSSLAPVTLLIEAPFVLVTNPDWAQKNGIGSVKDLVNFAARSPGTLSYGSAGPGNIAHLSFLLLDNRAKIKTTHIPYKAAAQAQMAVLSGELQAAFDTWTALPHIKAGKLKPLAISGTKRMAQLPDVPTVEEAGYAPFDATFWIGLLAPAGTSPQIVQKLHAVAHGVQEDAKAKDALGLQGNVVMEGPAGFAKRVEQETVDWGAVIRRENILLD